MWQAPWWNGNRAPGAVVSAWTGAVGEAAGPGWDTVCARIARVRSETGGQAIFNADPGLLKEPK